MGLPPANLILFFLSAFVGLWGVSVLVRGVRGRRVPGSRACPECGEDMLGVPGRRCPACEFEARNEEELERRAWEFRVLAVGGAAVAAGVALVPVALWVRGWEVTGSDRGLGVHPVGAMFWGVAAFGVVLAAWALRGDRSRGRRRCPKCWYDMSATRQGDGSPVVAGLVCPECGHDAADKRALYRSRRKWRAARFGVALLMVGICGQAVPRAMRVGPLGLAPTTALIAGMDWLPLDWLEGNTRPGTLRGRMADEAVAEWQVRWAGERAASRILVERNPRRLAFLLELATTGDAERTSRTVCGVAERLLSPEAAGWNVAETGAVHDALGEYLTSASWSPDGEQLHLEIPSDLVVRLLRSQTPELQWLGFDLAGAASSGGDSEVWAALWQLAGSEDRRTAYQAAFGLADRAARDASAMARWLDATRNEDPAVRAVAAQIMRYGPPESAVVGERLLEMLHGDTEITVAVGAVEALTKSGVAPETWASAVEEEFLGQRPHRALLAEALVGAWDPPPESFDVLRKGCADHAAAVRGASIWAMRKLLERADNDLKSAIMDQAARLLDDPDLRVQKLASVVFQAVVEISPEQAGRSPVALERAKALDTFGVVFDESEFDE